MEPEEYVPPENPFTSSPQQRNLIGMILMNNFRLAALSAWGSIELTQHYAQLVAHSVGNITGDVGQGMHALLFEAACFVDANTSTGGIREMTVECAHEGGCQGNCQEQAAFVEAAARGDYDAAVNVAKAVFKGGVEREDEDGERALSRLYAGVLISLAVNVGMDPMPPNEDG